jgi:CRP/FNR family transcriptional regulator, cyclic AMP receptor protein
MVGTTIELFRGLDESHVSTITALGQRVRLTAGEVLFRLGDDAAWLYSIQWGRVALTLPMRVRQREEDVLIEERLPGQTLGWSAVIPPHRVTMTASALAETELLAIPREPLLELLDARPELAYHVTRNVSMVIGHRLQVLQAMWLREMQRFVSAAHG